MINGRLIAFDGMNLRHLLRKIQRLENFANVVGVVFDMKAFEDHEPDPFAGPLFIWETVGDGSLLNDDFQLGFFILAQQRGATGLSLAMQTGQTVRFKTTLPTINRSASDLEGFDNFRDVMTVQKHLTANQSLRLLHCAFCGTHNR